jgi:hypothetical protein
MNETQNQREALESVTVLLVTFSVSLSHVSSILQFLPHRRGNIWGLHRLSSLSYSSLQTVRVVDFFTHHHFFHEAPQVKGERNKVRKSRRPRLRTSFQCTASRNAHSDVHISAQGKMVPHQGKRYFYCLQFVVSGNVPTTCREIECS